MARVARGKASRKRMGSLIGPKGPRKSKAKSRRTVRKPWSAADVRLLKQLAKQSTPTSVISLKLGRTEIAVRGKAQREGISLAPGNRSSFGRKSAGAPGRRGRLSKTNRRRTMRR